MIIKKSKEKTIKTSQPEEVVCVSSSDKEEMVCSKGGEVIKIEAKEAAEEVVKKQSNIFIGTLNFFAAPYRGLEKSYEKKYGPVKKLFYFDIVLLVIFGVLIGLNIYLFLSRPATSSFGLSAGQRKMVIQNGSAAPLPVTTSRLAAEIKINGQRDAVISPGEFLDYTIFYKNNSEGDLYDVIVKISLIGSILDFSQLEPGGGVLRDSAIVWTKDEIADLAHLPARGEGELKFKIGTTRDIEPAKILNFGSILRSWINISYKEKNFGEPVHWKSVVTENKINSDLTLRSLARYYTKEGDQLGRGPLPPRVGEITKYWIFWSVENNLNDLRDVSVSAILPPNVEWTGNESVSLGDLKYDSDRRVIIWKVGDASRYTGEKWPKQGVAFEVALKPDIEQVGKEVLLLNRIKIFSTDKFTGQFLERSAPDITTNLIYDNLAREKGIVLR